MVRIDCESDSELAIVLEIWEGGAVVHTSFPIVAGSSIALAVDKTQVAAAVTKCEPDHHFGYLIDIDVASSTQWFPQGYIPAWHSSALESALNMGSFVC